MHNLIKTALTAAGAVLLLAPASAASVPMSGSDTDDAVSIYVKGEGLHVDSVTASSERDGGTFRIYAHTGSAATMDHVTGWKRAKNESFGMTRISSAHWKLNRRFPDGTWLCAQSSALSGNPCIKVHH
ncbi:hypothetical protein [Streptomyces indicus]|uniref:Uncharacterized protein n=1 Tax=Streptomyces indicus TaxID=417292 RepID=A0A1G8ZJ32_9ACTN|nr:hypothetical protein [Streptomyces indicus]SDK15057.1 hypothetical protein SAMN05421806_10523 [Streptomyces indicus]